VTAPVLAQTSDQGHRVYEWQGQAFPSVTAILSGGIPKPALPRWAAKQAARYAVANADRLAGLPAEVAVGEIKRAPWAARDGRADLGSAVHALVEARITGRPAPELPGEVEREAAGYLAGFERFCDHWRPAWSTCEATVFNLWHGYAGTLDSIAVLDGGVVTLLDVKTGAGVYPEAGLQLAAYARGEFIGTSDGRELPLPEIEAAAVLHLRPRSYALCPVRIDTPVFTAFLAALRVFEWSTELAERVIGAPLTRPVRQEMGGDGGAVA
jgi:hypothetical protein